MDEAYSDSGGTRMIKSRNQLPYAAAIVTAVIFGFSFLFSKSALDHLSTFQLLGFRFAAAAAFLTLLMVCRVIEIKLDLAKVKALLVIALFQPVLYFVFETLGVGLTSASESGVVISLVPISITIFAVLILREHLSAFQWVSITVSVAGVILLVLAKGQNTDNGHMLGILALLCAVVAAGPYNVLSRKFSNSCTPMETTFVMMWVGAIVFNAVGITSAALSGDLPGYFTGGWTLSVAADLFYLGIVSSVGAFFLLNYSLSRMEASKSAAFMNLTPVVSVLAGIFLRGERFYLLQSVGAALILAGIWGTNRRQAVKETGGVQELKERGYTL
jgi:drug/metabolite transporter (DMT)-like permease